MNAGRRRTKIVCTIGPASASAEVVGALVDAGMDAGRLNFSHGTHEQHAERALLVREAQASSRSPARPDRRPAGAEAPARGSSSSPRTLATGEDVTITGDERADDGELPVAPAALFEALQPGHEVLIDDGLVRLRVLDVQTRRAACTVVAGGEVAAHKGVNLPGIPLPNPSLTDKDRGTSSSH